MLNLHYSSNHRKRKSASLETPLGFRGFLRSSASTYKSSSPLVDEEEKQVDSERPPPSRSFVLGKVRHLRSNRNRTVIRLLIYVKSLAG